MAKFEIPIKIDGFKCVEDMAQAVLNYTYKGRTLKEWADSISEPKTNADRIRQMGNNELALFFWAYVDGKGNSLEQWREWLKQDVCEKAFNKLTELTTNREEGE